MAVPIIGNPLAECIFIIRQPAKITKCWSIEIIKILRAKVLGLPHKHIRLEKILKKKKNRIYPIPWCREDRTNLLHH